MHGDFDKKTQMFHLKTFYLKMRKLTKYIASPMYFSFIRVVFIFKVSKT